MRQEIRAERCDEHGDLGFRITGKLVGFRLLRWLPNLRWLVPLPRHTHRAYRPDPNGWTCRPDRTDPAFVVLEVPRRYRPVARFLYRVELEQLIVADVDVG